MSRVRSSLFVFRSPCFVPGDAPGAVRSTNCEPVPSPGTPEQSVRLRLFADRFVNRFGTDRPLSSSLLPANGSGTAIKAEHARSRSARNRRAAAPCVARGRGHRLCARHDGLRAGRRGLEGARCQEDDAGARPDRHPEPRALAGRACRPYHPIGRYRDGRNGRLAQVSRPDCRSGSTDTWRRRSTRCRRCARSACSMPTASGCIRRCRKHPLHNNSDRRYFTYHRDTPGSALRINEPLQSRLTGRSTIILSKRIDRQDGSFAGVLTAAIDSDYFNHFYRTFQLGPDGSISLLRNDGVVLIRWPASDRSTNLSGTDLFSKHLKQNSVGYYKIISPFDGIEKYIGYEKTPHYPDGRHRGDVGRLAAVRLVEDAAHRRHRCERSVVHDPAARRGAVLAVPLPHEDRAHAARDARRITACWRTTSPTSSS